MAEIVTLFRAVAMNGEERRYSPWTTEYEKVVHLGEDVDATPAFTFDLIRTLLLQDAALRMICAEIPGLKGALPEDLADLGRGLDVALTAAFAKWNLAGLAEPTQQDQPEVAIEQRDDLDSGVGAGVPQPQGPAGHSDEEVSASAPSSDLFSASVDSGAGVSIEGDPGQRFIAFCTAPAGDGDVWWEDSAEDVICVHGRDCCTPRVFRAVPVASTQQSTTGKEER